MLSGSITWRTVTEQRTLRSGFVYEGPVGYAASLRDIRDTTIPGGIESGAHRLAAAAEEWMRANFRWTERTGDAVRGLSARVEKVGDKVWTVVLRHGVDYGIWLENRWNGRFAIVGPAQAVFATRGKGIIAGEIVLELRGRGSQFRHTSTGQFI